MRMWIYVAFVGCAWGSTAFAGPITADFSQGPKGVAGVHVTAGPVTATTYAGELYRWNDHNLCCDHDDFGLGVLSCGEPINPANPELNGSELILLSKPETYLWDRIWFSSVNDASSLFVTPSTGGPSHRIQAGVGAFVGSTLGYLPLTGADRLVASWLISVDPAFPASNYTLVWGADLTKVPEPVPEPGTLALLGFGCLLITRRLR